MLKRLLDAFRPKTRAEKHKDLLRDAALTYNRAHAYNVYDAKWMCPRCNEVHKVVSVSLWTGPHYPECCGIPAGDRYSEECAARTDNLLR